MLPICIASLPPVSGWLSRLSPPLSLLPPPPPPPPPLSSSSCTHLLERRCRCYPRVSARVSGQGCSLRRRFCGSVSLGADIRGWGTRALPGATRRCSPTVSCAPLRLSDTCRWDLDLTMVPFLWTCFEIPGGANGGNLKTTLLAF